MSETSTAKLKTNPELRKAIGARLRTARKASSLTVQAAAEAIGVSKVMVDLWEIGRSFPSPEHLTTVCDLYSVSADWLLGNIPEGIDSEEELVLLGRYRKLEPIYRLGIREAILGMLSLPGDSDESAEGSS
jgi:transcriptional regulator with XRE-family HTH domain